MIDDPNDAVTGHDVLDHIRPTVVVRRRIWEPPAELRRPSSRVPEALEVDPGDEDEDDDDLDDEEDDDELDDEVASCAAPPPALSPPSPPPPLRGRTLEVGDAISVATLAQAMGRSRAEIASELVARGFFEVTGKSVLSHEAACAAAAAFGWSVLRVRSEARPVPAARASGVRVSAKARARKATGRKVPAVTPRRKTSRRAA